MLKINIALIEKERKALNIKKMPFSRLLKMDDTAYGKIIKNKSTTLKTLGKIAKLLQIDWKRLIV